MADKGASSGRRFNPDNLDSMTLEQLVDGVIFQNKEGIYECVTKENPEYVDWKAKQAKTLTSDLLSYSFTKGSGNFLVVTGIHEGVAKDIHGRLSDILTNTDLQKRYPRLVSMAESINRNWDYFALVTPQLKRDNHEEIRSMMTAEIKDIIEEYYGIQKKIYDSANPVTAPKPAPNPDAQPMNLLHPVLLT